MNAGEERHVKIERPVPVHIVYQTVWMGSDGVPYFNEDLYGYDEAQAALGSAR